MELIDEYLAALEVGDAERVLALFAPDGIVHSPLYSAVPARQFYPTLFADTAELRITLRRVFRDDREAVAFWFDFTWVLADGASASSTVVDIAELTEDGLIASLHIVYDTAPIRGDFEQATRPHETESPEDTSAGCRDSYSVLPPDGRWPTGKRA
jgi:ketosteroid isomerase-like protein